MKKLILLIFLLSFSNAKAISNNVFDFNNSLDIGNYMVDNYTRWVCENYQCKETNKKTDGDFGTKSECEKACKKTSLNTSLNTNQDIFTSFKSPTTTTKANYQSYTNGNLFDYSNDNLFNYTITSTKPIKDYLSIGTIDNIQDSFTTMTTKGNITSVIDGLGFDTSLANPEVKTSTSPINSFFQNILKGLGFDQNKDDVITNTDLDKNEIGIETETTTTMPPGGENTGEEDEYIWVNEDYAFKIQKKYMMGFENIYDDSNCNVYLDTHLKIKKYGVGQALEAGVLYSYFNQNNERVFDSFNEVIFIPEAKNAHDKYYYYSFSKKLEIPKDINLIDDKGSIEILAVMLPKSYSHYTSKENNYGNWRNAEKFTIDFECKNKTFDSNLLKSYCKFSIVDPQPKSNFIDGKDPYCTNFKLAIKMDCSIPLSYNKFKVIPENILIRYKMTCPNHFNTDWQTGTGQYDPIFLSNQKEFKFDIDTQQLYFEKTFTLEDETLINILNNKFYSGEYPTNLLVFNLSKRCDLDIKVENIDTNNKVLPLASLKDYFYLNQCKVSIINESPDKIYCTEGKYGELLPIYGKVKFDCNRDANFTISGFSFDIFPDPFRQDPSIFDTEPWPDFGTGGLKPRNKTKNGQIFEIDFNESSDAIFDEYFKKGFNMVKNQASNPSNLTFSPRWYFVDHNLLYIIPNENKKANESFKVYYGWNDKCGNTRTVPTGGTNVPEPTTTTTKSKGISEAPTTVKKVFNIIGNFFKSLFK